MSWQIIPQTPMIYNHYGQTHKGYRLIILPDTDALGVNDLCVMLPNRWPDCVAYLNERYSNVWTAEGTTLIANFGSPFKWEVLEKRGRIVGFLPDIVDLSESLGEALKASLGMLLHGVLKRWDDE